MAPFLCSRGGWGAWGTPQLPTVCPPPPPQVQLINDAYNAVVDAVLGAEAELGEGRGPCAGILATLKHVRIPIVSLDVPSGPASRSGRGPPSPGLSPCPPPVSPPARGQPRGPPAAPGLAASPRLARSKGWRRLSEDAFRASPINNKLPELRHDVI